MVCRHDNFKDRENKVKTHNNKKIKPPPGDYKKKRPFNKFKKKVEGAKKEFKPGIIKPGRDASGGISCFRCGGPHYSRDCNKGSGAMDLGMAEVVEEFALHSELIHKDNEESNISSEDFMAAGMAEEADEEDYDSEASFEAKQLQTAIEQMQIDTSEESFEMNEHSTKMEELCRGEPSECVVEPPSPAKDHIGFEFEDGEVFEELENLVKMSTASGSHVPFDKTDKEEETK